MKLKMPTSYTTLFVIIALVAVMTWIVPAGQYEYIDPEADTLQPIAGTYSTAESNEQGIWDVLVAPVQGFIDAVDVSLYILIMGGYLAVIMHSGAIDAGIGAVIRKLKGREIYLIPVLMCLFALGGTTFGMWEETMAFYMVLIPVFIAAGFDSVVGVYVVALGAGLGTLGSTVNPFATGIASGFAGVSIGDGIGLRLVILAACLLCGIWYVMRYAKKVKADPKKSIVYDAKTANEKYFLGEKGVKNAGKLTGKHKAILSIFAVSFIIMVLGIVPWSDKFGITIFDDIHAFLTSVPVLGKMLGHMSPLGTWWFTELGMLFLTAAVITGFMVFDSEEKFFEVFVNGAKDLLGVVLIIGISRGITVVMNAGGMTATVLHLGEVMLTGISDVAFAVLTFVFYIPLSFFVPSSSGLATLSMPIIAPLSDFVGVGRDIAITAFQSANGLVNLLTPTSGVLMGALALGRVPYDRYIKHIWKLIALLFIVISAILVLGVLIG